MSKKTLPKFNPDWSEKQIFEYFELKTELAESGEIEEKIVDFDEFTKELNLKSKEPGHNYIAIKDRVKKSLRYKRIHEGGV